MKNIQHINVDCTERLVEQLRDPAASMIEGLSANPHFEWVKTRAADQALAVVYVNHLPLGVKRPKGSEVPSSGSVIEKLKASIGSERLSGIILVFAGKGVRGVFPDFAVLAGLSESLEESYGPDVKLDILVASYIPDQSSVFEVNVRSVSICSLHDPQMHQDAFDLFATASHQIAEAPEADKAAEEHVGELARELEAVAP